MSNFWSAVVTKDSRILSIDSIWSHEKIIKKYGLKDDKLGFVINSVDFPTF